MSEVVIVDDNSLILSDLPELVFNKSKAKSVDSVPDAKILIESFVKHTPKLVVMDINMPIMDGFEASKTIKNKYPDVKILILTGYDFESVKFRLDKIGVDEFVCKDESIDHLIKSINKLLD